MQCAHSQSVGLSKLIYRVYEPWIATYQSWNVNDALAKNELSYRGEYVGKFEKAICEALKVKHCIATANGSVSLFAIYRCLFNSTRRYVVVPSMTYAATVSQIILAGFRPLYIDCDTNFQANIGQIEIALRFIPSIAGIVIPTLYADAPDLDHIRKICDEHETPMVEDAAEAFYCKTDAERFVGTYGHASSFSFFANKIITTGEGGCVVTDNDELAERIRLFCNQNTTGGYIHQGIGTNFRLSNLPAAVGVAQMDDVRCIVKRKQEIASYYRKHLQFEAITPRVYSSSEWMPLFKLPIDLMYEKFRLYCESYGVEVRPSFYPIHSMNGFEGYAPFFLPVTDSLAGRHFILPCHPALEDNDLAYIVKVANSAKV